MKKINLFFFLLLLFSLTAKGQAPSKLWDKRFGGSGDESFAVLQQTANPGYILGGYSGSPVSGDKTQGTRGSEDFWVVSIGSTGVKNWDKRFGGSSDDRLAAIQQTIDGGFITAGYSSSGISGDKSQASRGSSDGWIVKINSNGTKQWDKRFGGTSFDDFNSVQQTTDGGYILGGNSSSNISGDKSQDSRGQSDYWIVKIDNAGNKQWDKRFGGAFAEVLFTVLQTSDGGYILGGASDSEISGDRTQASRGGADYWIVKVDSIGNKQWDRRFGTSAADNFRSLQKTSDGGYILAGSTSSGVSGDKTQGSRGGSDYWIVKINSIGTKQWDKRYGGSGSDGLHSIQQTTDGGYILGGSSYSGVSGDKTQASRGDNDFWIVKINANSTKLWDARFGGTNLDYLYSLRQTTDGGFILGGQSTSGVSGDKTQGSRGGLDFWIVKTASSPIAFPEEERNSILVSSVDKVHAYPNPFSEKLNIDFTPAKDSHGKLEVFDLTGKLLAQLFEGEMAAGVLQKFEFLVPGNYSGIVIYRLQTNDGIHVGKVICGE